MDWFEKLTGFREGGYAQTQARLRMEGTDLHSPVNGRHFAAGELELVSLQTLRECVAAGAGPVGRSTLSIVQGDVRRLHRFPEHAGALFQVASQFNLLEMVSPNVTPEDGVTGYQHDPTQGPACAIAAGAATIYRNYFVPVADAQGQTHERQLDGLADLGSTLADALGRPVAALWAMRNGYALCSESGLAAIDAHLKSSSEAQLDALRARLRIGVQRDVEVTDAASDTNPRVSQAFCSALPVAYSAIARPRWQRFAQLVLEAAYEATLWAAVLNARRGVSNTVLLTLLGGGAFGNDDTWIIAAIRRSIRLAADGGLDIRIVSYAQPRPALRQLVAEFA